jgi:hypothetical protein
MVRFLAPDISSLRGFVPDLRHFGLRDDAGFVPQVEDPRGFAEIRRGRVGYLELPVERPQRDVARRDTGRHGQHERLKDVMSSTTATPEQIAEAARINADSRRRALKLSFLLLGGVALLVIVPVGRLPDYVRGKRPSGPPPAS